MLSQGELLSTCILLLVAGHETSVNLIAGGALALMEHPDQMERFRRDPAVVRSAVEEMLRYVGPVQLTGRVALEPIEVGGVVIGAGEFAMLLVGSANRDPGPSRTRKSSTWAGPTTTTSASASGSTTASARRWPGSRPRWR